MNRVIPDHLSGDTLTTEIAERMDRLRGGAPRPGEIVRGTGGGGTSIPPMDAPCDMRDTAAGWIAYLWVAP